MDYKAEIQKLLSKEGNNVPSALLHLKKLGKRIFKITWRTTEFFGGLISTKNPVFEDLDRVGVYPCGNGEVVIYIERKTGHVYYEELVRKKDKDV